MKLATNIDGYHLKLLVWFELYHLDAAGLILSC